MWRSVGAHSTLRALDRCREGFPCYRTHAAYAYIVDGSTQFWFATVPGSSNTIVDVRDGIKKTLAGTGYVEIAQDQELGAEADYYFAGRYIGSVQVRPLCDGRLRVRYGFGAGSLGAPTLRHKGPPIVVVHSTPMTVPTPAGGTQCLAVPAALGQPLSWLPPSMSLPPGNYAAQDFTPSGSSTHAVSFVFPGNVADFFTYISKTWPGEGVTLTYEEQDPNDSEFVFEYNGHQGSLALTRPYCDPNDSSLVVAYGGS